MKPFDHQVVLLGGRAMAREELLYSEQYAIYRNVAAVVGGLYIGRLVLGELYKFGGGFCAYFLAPLGISQTNIKKYGKWAVVTGASEGIGRGYALELARRGLDVVIMSRSREKLDKVGDEIRSKYKEREVRVFPVDFSKGEEIYPDIAEELNELDIGVLVNNVGLSYEYPDYFCKVPPERLRNMVELNVQSMVQMTRLVLPAMEAKKKGVIVNLSAGVEDQDVPLLTVYRGTKVFVRAFSDGLWKEYADKGIYVQNVVPQFVATAMVGISKPSFFVPTPVNYARAAVNTIGIQKTTYGFWTHALQAYMQSFVPQFLFDRISFRIMSLRKQTALRRKAQEAKKQ